MKKKSLTKIYKKLTQNPALNKYEHQIIDSRGNTRWHSWIDSPILDKNGQLLEFQSVGRDITERIQNEKTLQHRLEIEAVLSKTSTRFVGVFNIDKAISQSLRDMTTFIQADRGYLFQFQHDKKYMDNTHEWCNKGVEPQIQNLQNIPCNLFPWWMTKLENNEIIDVKDVSKLPKEANEEKKILQTQEIKSLIVFPVYSGKRLSGYIGFDNINRSYALQGFDHKLLKMFSQVIGNALLQQQSETALRYSENRFRSMADNTQDGVIIFENNKIVYLNNRISEIWGLASDTIGKFSINEFLSPQDRKLVQEKKNSDLSELLPKKSEFWISHKNGTKRYIQNKYTIIPNNRGGYFYYLFCTDLTERKNAEEALKQSENQYHTLFEAAEDAIFLLRGSKPFDCNQAALKLFEGDKKDILNIPVYELSPAFQQNKKNSETLAKEIIQNVLNGHPQHFEWQHLTLSGKTVDTEVSLKRIELAGEMVLQAVIRDISTRKQIENERLRHLHFLESMEDIEKAISKTSDMDTIFDNILKTVTKIFACECAFLINPCLPSINTSNIEFIYTTDNIEKDIDKLITVDPKVANTFKLSLERHELIAQTTKTELAQFIGTKPVKAQLMMSLHPKTDKPWLFVIQHYKKEHEWVNEEKQLFIEISRRISDVLSNLITLKNLRESEEKFRALAENSLDTIMRFDSKGRHLYVNPIVEYQTGISWEKFIGKTHTEMGFPSHLVHLWDNSIRNVFLRRKPHRIEFQLPNNTWIDWQLIPEFSEDGDVKAVITSARDITEMKKTEKALIENEEKYRYLVERAYDSIVIVQNNKIKFVNAAFCRMFGYQKEEIIDKPYEILVAPESFKILKSHYNDRISNQSPPMIYEIKVKHKNGKIFDAELNAGKVLYYGKPSSFVFIRDITERKKALEAQRLAERAQRFGSLVTLTAGVSHEINQPLTALKVKVDGLIYWGEKDPQTLQKNILKNLEFISEQAGKIDQIIKHMRSLTRQEKMVPTAVDLNEIIKRASTLVSQRLKSHNVDLILKLETELKPVLGSDTPLEQVVINLITNSLHALDTVSMPKKQIIIQTHSDTEQCTMEVIDNGPGIDEERLEQIFDPFFTTKIQEEGMGLGLAIVQNILTNLDGKIKVSNNKNGGARFTVVLPIENKGNIR